MPIASFDVHQEYRLLYVCTVDGMLYRELLVVDSNRTADNSTGDRRILRKHPILAWLDKAQRLYICRALQ